MSLRKRIYEVIVALESSTGIVAANIFSSGAAGVEAKGKSPIRPFIMIRFQPDNPGLVPRYPVSQQRWNAWVHDEPGSMEKIDIAVAALKVGVPLALAGDGGGVRVLETVWEGTFADGYDDHFGTNLNYVDFMTTYKTIA